MSGMRNSRWWLSIAGYAHGLFSHSFTAATSTQGSIKSFGKLHHVLLGSRGICSTPSSLTYSRTRRVRRPALRPGHVQTTSSIMQSDSWKEAFRLPDVVLNRRIELGDLLLGYEQERQMSLQTPHGKLLLAVVEEPGSLFLGTIVRQIMESARAFTFNIYTLDDPQNPVVLYRVKRSFPWFNIMEWLFREITVEDTNGNIVAAATRNWHPINRHYDMYVAKEGSGENDDIELSMFSTISVPFWTAMFTWMYPMVDGEGNNHASIDRILGDGVQGLAVQVFTEKGNYLLSVRDNSFDIHKRLAMVACAISIDYDHYSRRAAAGGWLFPGIAVFGGGDD